MLLDQLARIALGSVFVFIGLATCAVAVIRRRGGVRILVWLGLFVGFFGMRMWAQAPAVVSALPVSFRRSALWTVAAINYLLVVPAILFWWEVSAKRLRRVLEATVVVAAAIGIAGLVVLAITGTPFTLMPYASAVAIYALLLLAVIVAVPAFARKLLLVQSGVLAFGTLVAAIAAITVNVSLLVKGPDLRLLEPPAFAVFVLSLLYVAGQRVFATEGRLLSIQKELEIAREIQQSILPAGVPEMQSVRVDAAYRPMTAVAGDFYDFLQRDSQRLGVLVADVSGHGVPAALIASMIKVAAQSAALCADDPPEVLRVCNRVLRAQLRGQFVSAAYLWIDTEKRTALYSAAGHPPLLLWRNGCGELERIESNGLLFGILPAPDYPVRAISFSSGDRFLLYTDGLIEPENSAGEPFGEARLAGVVRDCSSRQADELSRALLEALPNWQPGSLEQQDDITLIILDIV